MPCFMVNRSKLLEEVLKGEGWEACHDLEGPVDFAMWDPRSEPFTPAPPQAALRPMDNKELKLIDNKRLMWTQLRDHAADLLPETYLSLAEAPEVDAGGEGRSKVWFFKKGHTAGGKDVHCGSLADMRAAWSEAARPSDWLLQRSVPSLLLDGKKNTLRLYVLAAPDGAVYYHQAGLLIVHKKAYTEESGAVDPDVHVDHKGCARMPLAHHPRCAEVLEGLTCAVRRMFQPYQAILNAEKDASRYHLFGLDFIITPSCAPVLIEVNQYPNLSIRSDPVGREVKRVLFQDMYNILIAPSAFGTPPAPGGFVRVL